MPADNRQLANTKPISHGLSDTCKIARWAKGELCSAARASRTTTGFANHGEGANKVMARRPIIVTDEDSTPVWTHTPNRARNPFCWSTSISCAPVDIPLKERPWKEHFSDCGPL